MSAQQLSSRRRRLRSAAQASLFVLALLSWSAQTPEPVEFDAGKAPFVVRFEDEVIPYRTFAVFVLPGEEADFEAIAPDDRRFVLRASAGRFRSPVPNRWVWTAPDIPGQYLLEVVHPPSVATITLNVFVMVPLSQVEGGVLHGYRVGSYPGEPLRGLEVYEPPEGLIEVQPWNEDTPVSPHFRLGQFLCKQADGYPKYLVLDARLPRKLETVLEKLNANGVPVNGLHVMSGFRTPFYNASLGNVRYSIHQWGGAADVYVDERPKDGVMDDINRDGRVDKRDALFLYQFVDDMQDEAWFKPLLGGLGAYDSTPAHGPFVHMDTRGFLAHWGE